MRSFIFYIVFLVYCGSLSAQANFSSNVSKGCGPLNVQFTDLSANAKFWLWDLGNGNQSTLQNPTAIYSNSGYYDVQLTIVDNTGIKYTKSVTKFIHVFYPAVSYFTADKKKVCPNDSVYFTNQSTPGDGAITKYSWDFGDGNSSFATDPAHAYKTPAYRNVSLIVTDANGCIAVKKFTSFIQVWTPPTADFSLDTSLSCNIPTTVTFKSNVFPGGMAHRWDLGNGNSSTQENPKEVYTKFGKYNVRLTVTDANGCMGVKLLNSAVVIDNVIVDFNVQKTTICDTSTAAVFVNNSNIASGYTWQWDFGDGGTSSDYGPVHKYGNFGNYSVTLKATGPNCVAVRKKNSFIRVTQKPAVNLTVNDTGACQIPYNVLLRSNTSSTASVFWDFGDKSIGNGRTVTHQYGSGDTFKVKVIATEINGCQQIDSAEVSMHYLITIPDGELEGCAPFSLNLSREIFETTAPIVSEKWYLGNALLSTSNSVTRVFPDTGVFFIRYVGTSSKGCVDTPTYKVKVGLKSNPDFVADDDSICIGQNLKLTNLTPLDKKPIGFRWFSSEGAKGIDRDFQTGFRTTQGYVNITLIADYMGCSDTMVKKDSILVQAPRVSMSVPKLKCILPKYVPLINTTTVNSYFHWTASPAEHSKTPDTMWLVPGNQQYSVKLFARNDTTGCEDSFEYKLNFIANVPHAKASAELRDTCLPAKVRLRDLLSSGEEVYWQIANDTNKIYPKVIEPIFENYGRYIYHRIAIYKNAFQVCADTQKITIDIPKPDTRYSVLPPNGCTPLTITLLDSGYFTGKKAHWKIGDSILISTGFTNTFTIKTAPVSGTTDVVFTAFDSLGRCTESATRTLAVTGPVAEIKHGFHYTCKQTRLDLAFNKVSQPNIVKTEWYVDDTLRSTATTYSHFVPTVKMVRVVLVITDANGCTSEIPGNIYTRVFKPQIKIHSDVTGALCPPVTVSFSDSTYSFNNQVETWNWDFGDGATSTIKNPVHTYLNTGKYTVTLRVKNFVGCIATDSFPAFIDVKGPSGKIVTSGTTGCIPWKTTFSTTAKYLKDIVWDFGDGTGGNGVQVTHQFLSKGTYYPSAILEDSAGCKIGLTTNNTPLIGLESATAAIDQKTFCENDVLQFRDASFYPGISKNSWRLKGSYYTGANFQYTPVKGEKDTVLFIAFGPLGCNDTLHYLPRKSTITPAEFHASDTLCPGDLFSFSDISKSDTSIISRLWNYTDQTSSDSLANFIANTPGHNSLTLRVTNAFGCTETINWNNVTITGDTLVPWNPGILVSTVLPDNRLQLRFQRSNGFDWKNYTIYDISATPAIALVRVYDRDDTLQNISGLNLLHNSYCLKIGASNFCKTESDWHESKAHCQVALLAQPLVNANSITWNSYAGNDLKTTYLYRKELPAGMEVLLHEPGVQSNTFLDSNLKCKTNYCYRLESVFYNVPYTSSSDTSQAIPIYKTRILSPFIASATVTGNQLVTLNVDTGKYQKDLSGFRLEKSTTENSYVPWKTLLPGNPLELTDLAVAVDKQRYFYRISATDNCGGSSNWSRPSGNILLRADNPPAGGTILRWNTYSHWPGGVDHYEVEIQGQDGFFAAVHSTSDTQFLVQDNGSACGQVPKFRVSAYSGTNPGFSDSLTIQRSTSNEVDIEARVSIHVPNAFTPDANSLNELFRPEVLWAKDYRMLVYNRWGEKIAETRGCGSGWDGTYNGTPAPAGCYAYRIELTAANGDRSYHTGNVVLLR